MALTEPRRRSIMGTVKTELGRELRAARVHAGKTLRGLALETGVGVRTIHAIEVGDSLKPREETLESLAKKLHPYTSYERLALAAYNATIPEESRAKATAR